MLAHRALAIAGEPFGECSSQSVEPGASANSGLQEDVIVIGAFGFPFGAFAGYDVYRIVTGSF